MRTLSMKDLAAESGYPERSIRQYVLEGFLPRPPYHGKDTVYSEAHLTGLRAITKLRTEHKMHRLAPLRAWFSGKSAEQIEAFVTGVPIAPPATPAMPPAAPPPPPPPAPEPARNEAAELEDLASLVSDVTEEEGERWLHIPLVPGMMLLVRDGAPEVVQRLAGEIRGKYGAG
jgi:hypothetical protein